MFAALGGMAVAVLIFLAFNAGGSGAHGWGVAMSTDTAFALGLLALVAPGATRLRVRLLTSIVIDDLVALLVIATVYTERVDAVPLAIAAVLFGLLYAVRYLPMAWRTPPAVLLAVALWVALYESGIDPLISGLAIGLAISAYPPDARSSSGSPSSRARSASSPPRAGTLGGAGGHVGDLRERAAPVPPAPVDELRDRALFALANAGIHVDGDLLGDAVSSPITLGIVVGYVVGKPIGITAATWLATRRHRPAPGRSAGR